MSQKDIKHVGLVSKIEHTVKAMLPKILNFDYLLFSSSAALLLAFGTHCC